MHNTYIIHIVVVIAVVGDVENVGKLKSVHIKGKIYLFLPVDKVLEIVGKFCGFQHH